MAIIGFILSFIIMCVITFAWCIFAFLTLPKFTIGGALNRWGDRIAVIVVFVILVASWIALFNEAPFRVVAI